MFLMLKLCCPKLVAIDMSLIVLWLVSSTWKYLHSSTAPVHKELKWGHYLLECRSEEKQWMGEVWQWHCSVLLREIFCGYSLDLAFERDFLLRSSYSFREVLYFYLPGSRNILEPRISALSLFLLYDSSTRLLVLSLSISSQFYSGY